METVAPVVLLIARLLVMGPLGTEEVSRQEARIPQGGTGLLREALNEADFPRSLSIYLSPSVQAEGASSGDDDAAADEPAYRILMKAELWGDPSGEGAGAVPDEVNEETVLLNSAGKALVQIAENQETGRRLMLSLSMADDEKSKPGLPALTPLPSPRQVWFRVDAFRLAGTARERIGGRNLRTLEGQEVSLERSWRQPILDESGALRRYESEGIKLTVKPLAISHGWITVAASLDARILPPEKGAEVLAMSTSATRTVPLGIPFEISLEPPAEAVGEEGSPEEAEPALLVEITPILPPAPAF